MASKENQVPSKVKTKSESKPLLENKNRIEKLIFDIKDLKAELELSRQKEKFMVEHTDALTVLIEEANARTEKVKKELSNSRLQILNHEEINFHDKELIRDLKFALIFSNIAFLILITILLIHFN